jgi:BirA family biotin operon repressor/biotin-[acetyl-CoA-carboxylase] ligase
MAGLDLPPGYRLIALGDVDSTSDELKRLASVGAGDGTVVTARTQRCGRGRERRIWLSPPGNLYASILLRPDCAPADGAQLTFVAALAAADAVAAELEEPARVSCKWPNDVLIGGRKVAGILLESALAPAGRLEWIVVGIGINVAWHPAEGADLLYPATSVRAEGGKTATAETMLTRLVAAFDGWRAVWMEDGFDAVRSAWLRRAHALGRPVAVRLAGATLEGVFAGLDPGGAMVLATGEGRRQLVLAGDVFPASG